MLPDSSKPVSDKTRTVHTQNAPFDTNGQPDSLLNTQPNGFSNHQIK